MTIESMVNTGEDVTFQCAVAWTNVEPMVGQFQLFYTPVGSSLSETGSPTGVDVKGMYAIATFAVQPAANQEQVTCVFQEIVNGQPAVGYSALKGDYYNRKCVSISSCQGLIS